MKQRSCFLIGSAGLIFLLAGPLPSQRGGDLPRVAFREEMRIAGSTADLSVIRGTQSVALHPSGLVAVAQPQDYRILLFQQGRQAAAVGRQGEGPGEFAGINAIGWSGDTLWVRHGSFGNAGVELFSRSGVWARSLTMPRSFADGAVAGEVEFPTGAVLHSTAGSRVVLVVEDPDTGLQDIVVGALVAAGR